MALRCLIVDDNPGFLAAARALLEQEGVVIVGVASTGAEAALRAADLSPDVTLLDVHLGPDNGFDVARRLVDDPGLRPGRLIMISSHSEEELGDLIETSPAIGYLGKPSLSASAIDGLLRGANGRGERTDRPLGL